MTKRVLFISFNLPQTNVLGDNTGNQVYYLSLLSYFYQYPNLTILPLDEIVKKINEDKEWAYRNFDIAIIAEANIFALWCKDTFLPKNTNLLKSLKIPCYVIGIGCQNDIENNLKNLEPVCDPTKNYVDTVLNSGGTLALRGELTGEYLKSLGYDNLFVSGCPSMYINGINYTISDEKVEKENFKPMFNGADVQSLDFKLYKDYPNSSFFDQDIYLKALFEPKTQLNNKNLEHPLFIKLFKEGRIRGDINYYPWRSQIIENGFNFSYGSRIHGNIIALQAKIPSFIKVIDSRTREIAEFYNIPNSLEYNFNEEKDSLYDLYNQISFEKFNNSYIDKLNRFKNFLNDIIGEDYIKNRIDENYMDYLSSFEYISYDKNYNSKEEYLNLIKKLKKKNGIFKIIKTDKYKTIYLFGKQFIKIKRKTRKDK